MPQGTTPSETQHSEKNPASTDLILLKKISLVTKELAALQVKCREKLVELEALLVAAPTPGDQVRRLFAAWSTKWKAAYQTTYIFSNLKDAAQFKRLLKTLPVEELEARMDRFLRNREAFYVQARHSLAVFVHSINAHGGGAGLLVPAVEDCKHDPACHDDLEHTRRKLLDMRGGLV